MERLSKSDLPNAKSNVAPSTPTKKLNQTQPSVSIDLVASSPSNSGVRKFFKKKFSLTESQAHTEQIEFDQVGSYSPYLNPIFILLESCL